MTRIVLALCAVLLSACADRESYINRAEGIPLLLGELQSFSSEQEVRAALTSWRIQDVERSGLSKGDRRPPFDIVTLSVAEYQHLGVKGELRLTLFNDRLMDAWFYPTDIEAYMAALKEREVAVATGTERSTGTLRVWSKRGDRTYVAWSDGRLQDQSTRWISRYS